MKYFINELDVLFEYLKIAAVPNYSFKYFWNNLIIVEQYIFRIMVNLWKVVLLWLIHLPSLIGKHFFF